MNVPPSSIFMPFLGAASCPLSHGGRVETLEYWRREVVAEGHTNNYPSNGPR
jgi:hypothetical protein